MILQKKWNPYVHWYLTYYVHEHKMYYGTKLKIINTTMHVHITQTIFHVLVTCNRLS